MSFNAHNIAGPPLWILTIVAIATVPTETALTRTVFWAGAVITYAIFYGLYVPRARGDPGGAFCCSTALVLGVPAVLGVATETGRALLKPGGVAAIPWVAMSAGPAVYVAFDTVRKLREARAVKRALRDLQAVTSVGALPPFLVHSSGDVRDRAVTKLFELDPSPAERRALVAEVHLTAKQQGYSPWYADQMRRVVDTCLSIGPFERDALLDLYTSLNHTFFYEDAARLLELELFRLDWSDDPAPLVTAARAQLEHRTANLDALLLHLLGLDREAALTLASDALRAGSMEAKTALAFGPEEGHRLIAEALDAAPDKVQRTACMDAALTLPPELGYPLLTRVVLLDGHDLLSADHLREQLETVPRLFAEAPQVPEEARALLAALREQARGDETLAEAWAGAAEALQRELGEVG